MIIHPRSQFKTIIRILDIINPFLVISSIIGLFLEYTDYRIYVELPNTVISILFVLDFVLRLMAHNPGNYFFRAYGWVDFLASLPGFMFFLENTPLLGMFKIIRIGRFFRIIRILRFLRIFSFMKRMKADSTWVQDRIMQVGVTVVLVFVSGIIYTDRMAEGQHKEIMRDSFLTLYTSLGEDLQRVLKEIEDIPYYSENSVLFDRRGEAVTDLTAYKELTSDEMNPWYFIPLKEGMYSPDTKVNLPVNGVLIPSRKAYVYHNHLMLALLSTLLVILTTLIFYLGFVFARDMQIIQLIVDSFDAGDDLLLKQEAEQYRDEEGALTVDPEENELISLLKVTARIDTGSPLGDFQGLPGMGLLTEPPEEGDLSSLQESLDRIEMKLEEHPEELIKKTIKAVTPAIIKYLEKKSDSHQAH